MGELKACRCQGSGRGLRTLDRHTGRVRSRRPAPGSVFVFKRPAICAHFLPCRAWLCLDTDARLSPRGGFPAQRGQRRPLGTTPPAPRLSPLSLEWDPGVWSILRPPRPPLPAPPAGNMLPLRLTLHPFLGRPPEPPGQIQPGWCPTPGPPLPCPSLRLSSLPVITRLEPRRQALPWSPRVPSTGLGPAAQEILNTFSLNKPQNQGRTGSRPWPTRVALTGVWCGIPQRAGS